MDKETQILNWLRTTCDDEDDHTCENCFQGRESCEYKYLADIIQKQFNVE